MTPNNDTIVTHLKEHHQEFLAEPPDRRVAILKDRLQRIRMNKTGYKPAPVKLSWTCDDPSVTEFTVEIATTSDFAEPIVMNTALPEAEVYKLQP